MMASVEKQRPDRLNQAFVFHFALGKLDYILKDTPRFTLLILSYPVSA
jgi:hypothetical protein